MANIRATLFFESGKYGWSETYFRVGTTNDVRDLAYSLGVQRLRLCGSGVSLTYIRASNDAVRRDSRIDFANAHTFADPVVALNPNAPQASAPIGFAATTNPDLGPITPRSTIAPADGTPADRPYSSVLVRMESLDLYRRAMYLRGVPDRMITHPVGPSPTRKWTEEFVKWKELLLNGWRFKVLSRENEAAPERVVIQCSTATPCVITTDAHGYTTGDSVRLFGLKGPRVPNGVWTIDVLTANTFSLRGSIGPYTWDQGGKVIKRISAYMLITDAMIRGQTSRKTGRPFDSPVGRRKKKK